MYHKKSKPILLSTDLIVKSLLPFSFLARFVLHQVLSEKNQISYGLWLVVFDFG